MAINYPYQQKTLPLPTLPSLLIALLAAVSNGVSADSDKRRMESVEVIGVAPVAGELNVKALPYAVQVFTKEDLNKSGVYSISEMLSSQAGSVTFNTAQNNRLQPDLQYRGYTASPLLGLSQGMAVYQNGVRVNEVFGDSVNWDLLTSSSVESMQIVAGSNPVYGLNALGGAITVQTKTGFSAVEGTEQCGQLGLTVGSDSAREIGLSHGGNHGIFGYYVAIDGMEEDGWRDFSDSDATNLYSALSWRSEKRELDLFFNAADTSLRGNGSSPEVLLEQRREAVFTHPDITENKLGQVSLSFREWFDDVAQLSVNGFFRRNKTNSFNGDGSEYEECEAPLDSEFLCDDDEEEVVEDQFGNPVSEEWNAINNRSERKQKSFGLTLQWLHNGELAGYNNQLLFGADYINGKTEFDSSVEFAALTESRGTTGSGFYSEEEETHLEARTRTFSLYVSDRLQLSDQLSATFSARYNDTHIKSHDPTGENRDLEGNHVYKRGNIGVGLLYVFSDSATVYGNIQQSSRAPTPVELACSHPEAPCNLPNSFLADPPLDDVVSRNLELGLRGSTDLLNRWSVGLFHATNRDDIIFQTTGGVSSNEGFFTNAVDTVRKGIELNLAGAAEKLDWYVSYTYLHASFDDGFLSSTPNHTLMDDDDDGTLWVESGSRLPGLPEHSLKVGVQYQLSKAFSIGVETVSNSGQYLRGDEANLDEKTDSFTVVNLFGSYQITDNLQAQLKVDNLFDTEYETFGLYGEADEVLENIDEDESSRFLGAGAPRQIWFSVNLNW
jgi:iron complex outermembrane receptor protein